MLEDRLAVAVLDAVDQCRLDLLAAIGDDRIGRDHVETAPMVDLSKQDQPDVGIVPAEAPETAAVTEETAAVEAAASPAAAEEAPAKKARPRRSRKKAVEPAAETTATEDAVPTDVEAEGASSVDNQDDGSTGGAMAAMNHLCPDSR